jgi:CYTH domain-containing protein
MALEIERRFLVTDPGWKRHVSWQKRMLQGYLVSGQNDVVVRVRSSLSLCPPPGCGFSLPHPPGQGEPTDSWLTIKAPASGQGISGDTLTRLEFEYPIPEEDARLLLGLSPHRLSKSRHGLVLPGGDWVVDVFDAPNAPLTVAEVELSDPAQAVAIPPWCGHEITGRGELSNAALATHPLQQWSEAERRALLCGKDDP